ncbi:MAG: hypothetical protein MJZ93_00210 [Paludibacteraceae bacterium]|nr:hypothetical protein [Paludibacteraceae bacterium]
MKKVFIVLTTICLFLAGCSEDSTNDKVMKIVNGEQYTVENIQQISKIINGSNDLSKDEVENLYIEVGNFIRMFAEHTADSLNNCLNNPDLEEEELNIINNEIDMMSKMSNETGVEFFKSEGYVVYGIMPIFIANIFHPYLTDEEYRFSEIEQMEYEDPATLDAAVTISYQEIADRLWECDKLYSSQNVTDELKTNLQTYRNTYIITLMYGADNTPAFNWQTHKIQQEIKDALLNYVKDHPNAESTPTLKDYIVVLERGNYYETQATRAYYFNYLRNN